MGLSAEQRGTISQWAVAVIQYRTANPPIRNPALFDVMVGKGVPIDFIELINTAADVLRPMGKEAEQEFLRLVGIRIL